MSRAVFPLQPPPSLRLLSLSRLQIFPTGGWGSIEYGTVGFTEGQVVGGRWKALQHFFETFLFTDAFLACGVSSTPPQVLCFVRNDDPISPLDAVATVTLARISGAGAVLKTTTTPISLPRGAGAVQFFCFGAGDPTSSCAALPDILSANGCAADGSDCVLFSSLTSRGVQLASSFELLGLPGALKLADPALTYAVAPAPNGDGSLNISLSAAAAPAAFVSLTSTAQGRFSDNAFWLPAAGSSRVITFIPFGALDIAGFAATLRVEHLQQYL